jgi:hypothetical protein
VSLKARILELQRRSDPGGLCDCPPEPLGDDWPAKFRETLKLLSPDDEEREAAAERQREKAATPCERCGRRRLVVMIEAVDNWSPMGGRPAREGERSTDP